MRYQGKITEWKDEKGFGFVTPNGGGTRVFVHIKSFSSRKRRPIDNDLITYELRPDARGRPQAFGVAFVGDRPVAPPAKAPGPGVAALMFAATFLAFVAGAVAMGKLSFMVLIVYLVGSCVAYLAYALDKAASLNDRRRTSEIKLHFFSLMGGWPGAMLAQKTLRHKTQKQPFQVTYWVTVVVNCAVLGLLLSPIGMSTIQFFMSIV